MKIYGSYECPDCQKSKQILDNKGIDYEFINVLEDLKTLKTFIHLRDTLDIYKGIKDALGIPLFEKEGEYTRHIEDVL